MTNAEASQSTHKPRHAQSACLTDDAAHLLDDARPVAKHAARHAECANDALCALDATPVRGRHAAHVASIMPSTDTVDTSSDASIGVMDEGAEELVASSAESDASSAAPATVPIARYRMALTGLVAVAALFAVVLVFSPFNPLKALKTVDSPSTESDTRTTIVEAPDLGESAYASDMLAISMVDRERLEQVVVNGRSLTDEAMLMVTESDASFTSQVGTLSQNAVGLPSGCEIVSLAVLLQSEGFDATPTELADEYLVMDGSFATGYAGSPYGAGGGFPPGIVRTANAYLAAQGAEVYAYDLTGTSFEGLKALIEHGYPVLVWSTMFADEPMPSGAYEGDIEWYNNEHCVVVYGITDEGVQVSDPMEGYVVRNEEQFARIYDLCGSMSVVII